MNGTEFLSDLIVKSSNLKKFSKNSLVFCEGDSSLDMYIILTGRIEVFIIKDSKMFILGDLGPGEFIGEMSLLESQPRSAYAVATEDANLLAINPNNFNEIITRNPQLALRLMRGLSNRVRETTNRMKAIAPKVSETSLLSLTNIKCPACGNSFSTYSAAGDKLVKKERDYMLRYHYDNFNPFWYLVIVCPQCRFAGKAAAFNAFPAPQRRLVISSKHIGEQTRMLDFSSTRTINVAIASLQLAVAWGELLGWSFEEMGELYSALGWLEKDKGEGEQGRPSFGKAIDCYLESLSGRLAADPRIAELLYLAGVLTLEGGDTEKARELLSRAASFDRPLLHIILARNVLSELERFTTATPGA